MVLSVAGGCGRKEAPRVEKTRATEARVEKPQVEKARNEEPLQLVDVSQPEDTAPSTRLTAEAPKKMMPHQRSPRPMLAPERPAPVPDSEARELVSFIRPDAERGDSESQYLLGIFYVNGSGVPADRVEALKWLLLASAQNHKEAISARDLVTKLLSAQQRAEAEKRAKEFTPAKSPGTAKP